MQYIAELIKRVSNSRNAMWIALAIIVLTHLPGANLQLSTDDFMIRAQLVGSERLKDAGFATVDENSSLAQRISSAFHFFSYQKGTTQQLRSYGALAWWSSPNGLMQPFRPVAAFTHWLDFDVFKGSPFGVGVLSLTGVLLLWSSIYLLARHLSRNELFACFVASLVVLDFSLWQSFLWLAARNVYLAMAAGTLGIYFYIRWRESGGILRVLASLCFFVISLLTAEGSIAVIGYLVAYAVALDRGAWWRRCLAVLPFVVVLMVWRACYNKAGFGAENIGLYVDPGRSPVEFLKQLMMVYPCIVTSLITGVDALVSSFSPDSRTVVRVIAWMVTLLFLAFAKRYAYQDKVFRFMLFGALIAVIPHSTLLSAGNRSGAFVAIGFFYVLAYMLRDLWQKGEKRNLFRWISVGGVGWHLVLPGVVAFVFSIRAVSPSLKPVDLADLVPDSEDKRAPSLVVVNSPSIYKLFYLPFEFDYVGHALPASINAMVPGLTPLKIERVSEKKFVVSSDGPMVINQNVPVNAGSGWNSIFSFVYVHQLLQGLVTDPKYNFNDAAPHLAGQMQVVTKDSINGVPSVIEVDFVGAEDPDSMIWARFDWAKQRYVAMPVPRIGQTVELGGPFTQG